MGRGSGTGPAARRRPPRTGLRRYLGADERVELVTRQHPFSIMRHFVDALLLLLPLLLVAWGIAGIDPLRNEVGDWLIRILLLLAALVLVRFGWRVLEWECAKVLVTNEKVIHVHGVLNRRIASTPLAKVSELTVHQPLLGRVFDYGSMVVDVPGGREQALHGLDYLPDPAGLYRLIVDVMRRGRSEQAVEAGWAHADAEHRWQQGEQHGYPGMRGHGEGRADGHGDGDVDDDGDTLVIRP